MFVEDLVTGGWGSWLVPGDWVSGIPACEKKGTGQSNIERNRRILAALMAQHGILGFCRNTYLMSPPGI
jgi:hypothetical protein